MQCLEPLVMLPSLLGSCLGNVALIDLSAQKLVWSCLESFRRDKNRVIRALRFPAAAQPSWM